MVARKYRPAATSETIIETNKVVWTPLMFRPRILPEGVGIGGGGGKELDVSLMGAIFTVAVSSIS